MTAHSLTSQKASDCKIRRVERRKRHGCDPATLDPCISISDIRKRFGIHCLLMLTKGDCVFRVIVTGDFAKA
jgi:hypothetical protein